VSIPPTFFFEFLHAFVACRAEVRNKKDGKGVGTSPVSVPYEVLCLHAPVGFIWHLRSGKEVHPAVKTVSYFLAKENEKYLL
jgi:hypothetical protein